MELAADAHAAPTIARLAPRAPAAQKRELRAFLMSRRARLKPADVGLPDIGRRRVSGLRREEVAALAGLSTAWYTMFEMAKETRVSRKTLDAIANALKLSRPETRHLYVLANAATPVETDAAQQAVDPVVGLILDGYRTGPALVLNARTDVLAMNDIAVALFGQVSRAAGYGRNWLWLLFANRLTIENWEQQARGLTATFRATYCEHASDGDYNELLDELLRTSDAFRTYWTDHDVTQLEDVPPLVLRHPVYGELRFAFRALQAASQSNVRCCFLVPDAETLAHRPYRDLLLSLDVASSEPAV